jgi:hypothetical protein
MGKDEVGETYLCCQKSDLEDVAELMEADIPSVESCLMPGKSGIKRCVSVSLEPPNTDRSFQSFTRSHCY